MDALLNSPIQSEVDFTASGRNSGFLRLPYSVHRSAYGWLPIPIMSIRNGSGPKVLVMAGNHGDEYEGQILISRLMEAVTPDMVQGQLLLLPMANFPAAKAGRRTSPLDEGNLNRLFPGDPRGTPSQVIAHYIESVLLEGANYLIDLHSGGSSLVYLPSLMIDARLVDTANDQHLQLAQAFGLPNAWLHGSANDAGCYSSSAATRQGAIALSTELGGGGAVTPSVLKFAEQGLRHLLGHIGVLQGSIVPSAPPGAATMLHLDAQRHYVYATEEGVFEPLVELGDDVLSGQEAARIHFPDSPLKMPETLCFEAPGLVVCKRVPAQVRRGDCLFHLAGR